MAEGKKITVQDRLTTVTEAILRGFSEDEAVAFARKEWSLTKRAATDLVDRAFTELEHFGRLHRERAFGVALARYEKLFGSALKIQDYKTALQVQKEISRLHGL